MTVHPQIGAFLATLPPGDGSTPDVAAWRAEGESHVPPVAERVPVHSVVDSVAETSTGSVPVRVYRTSDALATGVVVYFHGGAFFSGSLETHDHIARAMANSTGFTVVSVGYRLAPEAAYPAGLDDCFAVVKWVDAHADELIWDGTRLALVGDSSGGSFVAAVTARAHDEGFDKVTHQVLLYPSVDLDFDESRYPSLRENAVGFGLETKALKPHNSLYIASGASPADPLVSPIKRTDLSGLPQALVITAEHDPLRDEGEAYAVRLRDAGVPVTIHRYDGATHGFVQYFGWLPEYAGVFDEIADFVRS
jgi:acetyl esterase